jgi:hypothetical protein
MTQREKNIAYSNPAIFGLRFCDYKDGEVIFSEPSDYEIQSIQRQIALFDERQEAINNRQTIAEGDYVLMKTGEYSRVTVASWPDSVQIGGSYGGSYYLNSNGTGSYSGGCGDSIKKNTLQLTTETKPGNCWIFLDNSSGAHRGVHDTLQFKVWKEITPLRDVKVTYSNGESVTTSMATRAEKTKHTAQLCR